MQVDSTPLENKIRGIVRSRLTEILGVTLSVWNRLRIGALSPQSDGVCRVTDLLD